ASSSKISVPRSQTAIGPRSDKTKTLTSAIGTSQPLRRDSKCRTPLTAIVHRPLLADAIVKHAERLADAAPNRPLGLHIEPEDAEVRLGKNARPFEDRLEPNDVFASAGRAIALVVEERDAPRRGRPGKDVRRTPHDAAQAVENDVGAGSKRAVSKTGERHR